MKKPKVDQDKCIGCGLCVAICPEVFQLGEDGKSHVVGECPNEAKCQEAIGSCPTVAIFWEENEED